LSCYRVRTSYSLLSFCVPPPPPCSSLFPYTTLFRSRQEPHRRRTGSPARTCPRLSSTTPSASCNSSRQPVWHRTTRSRCGRSGRSEEHTSELQSRENLVCRLLLEKKKSICDHTPLQT